MESKISESMALEAIDLHKAGLSMAEILKRTHCSESGLSRRMLVYGYDIRETMRERKRQKEADLLGSILELYPYIGTLEISSRLGIRQSKVQAMLIGTTKKRTISEERKLNQIFNESRRKKQNLMVCSGCGEEALFNKTGLCGLCSSTDDGDLITEQQALFELDAGWLSRNLQVNNSPPPPMMCIFR